MNQLTKEHKFHSIDLKMSPNNDQGYFSTVEINIAGQTPFVWLSDKDYERGKAYRGDITDTYFSNPERSKENTKAQFDKDHKALTHAEAMYEILCQLKEFDKAALGEALNQLLQDSQK